jgi:hypothetical protein
MRSIRILAVLAVAVTVLGASRVETGARGAAAPQASGGVASVAACPVDGQCGVDPKTGCPTGGPASGAHTAPAAPIQVAPPEKCVQVPTTLFYVRGSNAGGCSEVLFVQLKLQPGITRYESVVYATIGLGTRWWADPRTPTDQTGPATQPGHTFTYGATSYTVPQGYLAWDVGGGSGGDPAGCNDTAPPGGVYGSAAWGVEGGAAGGSGSRGTGTLSIQGPTRNAYHVLFNEVISGTAGGAANYVLSGEQLGWTPCASTLLAEQRRSGWTAWPTGTGSVRGSFRLVARFYSRNRLKHAICSYLVNRATKHTYAHAARYWSNA